MELHQIIDRSLETPTPLRLDDHLVAGRRAVRQRRIAVFAGAVAAVFAVGTLAVAAAVSGSPDAPGFAADSALANTSPGAPAASAPPTSKSDWVTEHGQINAGYSREGGFEVRPGWDVVERIDDLVTVPMAYNGPGTEEVPDDSVAVTISKGTRVQWILTWRHSTHESSFGSSSPTNVGPTSLRAWAAIQIAIQSATDTDEVANVSSDGAITGRNGVEILDQRRTPELDLLGTTTSVAKVVFPARKPYPGWIVAVRDIDIDIDTDSVRTYPVWPYPVGNSPDDDGPDTIDGLIDWVAPQMAGGAYP